MPKQEAAGRSAAGKQEAGGRTDPLADFGHRRAARAADPAGERVSIRDLPAILEGIAEAVGHTKNALYITEHVRARLARQLCHANLSPGGYLPLIALSPIWEQAFAKPSSDRRRTPARHGAVQAAAIHPAGARSL
jgi:hypothetical protein